MIAVDTNLLVYAFCKPSEFHADAKAVIDELRNQSAPWAIPWPCVHELISVATNPRIYEPASTLVEVFAFLDALFASPHLHLLAESDGYFERLREIAVSGKISGARIHDARIAALCLHHGVRELWTADRDFSKFPKLKTRNPLRKK